MGQNFEKSRFTNKNPDMYVILYLEPGSLYQVPELLLDWSEHLFGVFRTLLLVRCTQFGISPGPAESSLGTGGRVHF